MVYHYTKFNCIESILGLGQMNSDCPINLTFWAFSALSCIGQEELAYRFQQIRPILQDVENELNIPYIRRVSRIEEQSMLCDYDETEYVDFKNSVMQDPYIVSFSMNSNNKKLWTEFDSEVCLCMDEDLFDIKSDQYYATGFDVSYGIEKEKLKNIILYWYSLYISYFENRNCNVYNDIVKENLMFLNVLRYQIFPFIKGFKFADENEFRISAFSCNTGCVINECNGRNYIKLLFPVKTLSKIVFREDVNESKILQLHRKMVDFGYKVKCEDRTISSKTNIK